MPFLFFCEQRCLSFLIRALHCGLKRRGVTIAENYYDKHLYAQLPCSCGNVTWCDHGDTVQ
jgi:hypothetical protein